MCQKIDGWIRFGWFLATMLFLSMPAIGQTATPIEEQLIEARGYTLNLKIQRGDRPKFPTIILESGGGADSSQWSELQPLLAAETGATVISYDRPGYGGSPLPDKPYDIVEEVKAFHDALLQLGLADSVLPVGHSYGGFLVQLYANLWPNTVQGLLFLDPNTPSVMLGLGFDTGQRPITNPVTAQERADARVDAAGNAPFAEVYSAPLPSEIPLIVLSAEIPVFPQPRQIEVVRLSHELLAASVEDGKRVIAERSNHMIPSQRPDLVMDYVKELLAKGNQGSN